MSSVIKETKPIIIKHSNIIIPTNRTILIKPRPINIKK